MRLCACCCVCIFLQRDAIADRTSSAHHAPNHAGRHKTHLGDARAGSAMANAGGRVRSTRSGTARYHRTVDQSEQSKFACDPSVKLFPYL